jgi:hypothetical protein
MTGRSKAKTRVRGGNPERGFLLSRKGKEEGAASLPQPAALDTKYTPELFHAKAHSHTISGRCAYFAAVQKHSVFPASLW